MKKGHAIWALIIALFIIVTIIGTLYWQRWSPPQSLELSPAPEKPLISDQAVNAASRAGVAVPTYEPKSFDLAGKMKGLSPKQINEHITLYHGYVKKRNEIEQKLLTVDRKNSDSRTYSPFRALKVAETYALNGQVLHELYFENLSPSITSTSKMGQLTKKLIEQSFGSVEAFKADFFDSAGVSRGWVLTCYVLDNGLLHNYVLDEHNIRVPIMVIPILVLDVYEHAYMIDFGIHRQPYLEVFWNHIDWAVVEQRVSSYIEPLSKKSPRE